MAQQPKSPPDSPEQLRLAVFGESGSGKTTLLSSYFGKQQARQFESEHGYYLMADDRGQGNRLLSNYYGLQGGHFPVSTAGFARYEFGLHITDLPNPPLKVCWLDYPGKWWTQDEADPEALTVQKDGLEALLKSHVGILLVDGARFKAEEGRYLCKLLDQFRNEVRRQGMGMQAKGLPCPEYPKRWLLALSKADLFPPTFTAQDFERKAVLLAARQLEEVAVELKRPDFGHQYILLSSVEATDGQIHDPSKSLGLEMLAPLTLVGAMRELAASASRGQGWGPASQVLEIFGNLLDLLDKLDDFLPAKYQIITLVIKALKLKEGAAGGHEYFKKQQAESARKGNALDASISAMLAELTTDQAQRLYYVNQR